MKNLIVVAIVLCSIFSTPIMAQAPKFDKVEVKVEGLGCPFCAFGLEKKMKAIQGVQNINIDVESGMMVLEVPMTASISQAQINAKVEEAGYTAKHIEIYRAEPISVTPRNIELSSTENVREAMAVDHSHHQMNTASGFCCKACEDANCQACVKKDGSACVAACQGCNNGCSGHQEGSACSEGCSHHQEGGSCSEGCSHHKEGSACGEGCSHHKEGSSCGEGCSHHSEGSSCSGDCSHHQEGSACASCAKKEGASSCGFNFGSYGLGASAENIVNADSHTFSVSGSCGMCSGRILRVVEQIDGVSNATYDLDKQELTLTIDTTKVSLLQVKQAIAAKGHDTDEVKAENATYDNLPGCCKYRD